MMMVFSFQLGLTARGSGGTLIVVVGNDPDMQIAKGQIAVHGLLPAALRHGEPVADRDHRPFARFCRLERCVPPP